MKAAVLHAPGGLGRIAIVERDARAPLAGEIRVRIHASSLNFHDYAVATGNIPAFMPISP